MGVGCREAKAGFEAHFVPHIRVSENALSPRAVAPQQHSTSCTAGCAALTSSSAAPVAAARPQPAPVVVTRPLGPRVMGIF